MKINVKSNLLLLATLLCLNYAVAQNPISAKLVGTWKLDNLQPKFPDNFTEKQKKEGEKTIADDTKEFKKASFIFTKEGSLSVGKKAFTWTMENDGKTVTVKKQAKAFIVATVLELTDHKLVFTRPDDGMIVTYTLVR